MKGIPPAQRRPLAQGSAGAPGHQEEHHQEDGHANPPAGIGRHLAGQPVQPLQSPPVEGREHCPEQQVAQHGKAVPDHAGDGGGILLQVLDGQAVQAGMELVVELRLSDAEKEHDAAGDAEPQARPYPFSKPLGKEQPDHQGQGHDARHDEVETCSHDKGLDEVRSRCRRGQIAVPEQKQQPQQLFQEQEQQEVAGEKGEVGKEGAGGGRPGRGHMESRSICNGRRIIADRPDALRWRAAGIALPMMGLFGFLC